MFCLYKPIIFCNYKEKEMSFTTIITPRKAIFHFGNNTDIFSSVCLRTCTIVNFRIKIQVDFRLTLNFYKSFAFYFIAECNLLISVKMLYIFFNVFTNKESTITLSRSPIQVLLHVCNNRHFSELFINILT